MKPMLAPGHLGARIGLAGWRAKVPGITVAALLALAATELVVMFVCVQWIARRLFKLDRDFSLLLAAGTAICGAAAILSVASLIRARSQQAAIAITLITL